MAKRPTKSPAPERSTMGTIRPQILLAITCGTLFSGFAAWLAYQMQAVEVMTAVIGSIFGFLGGVSLKILENE